MYNTNEHWSPIHRAFRKTCPVCGTEFYGRRNRRYCCVTCKSKVNNDKARSLRERRMHVSKPVIQNWEVLDKVWNDQGLKEARMSFERLEELGFNPEAPSSKGMIDEKNWFILNGYAYRPIVSDGYMLIRKIK